MTTGSEFFLQAKAGSAAQDSMSQMLAHPPDVLDHPSMSVTEKRALLALGHQMHVPSLECRYSANWMTGRS
jgi:hypothetical protein